MNISAKDLEKIAKLAYLDVEDSSPQLIQEINDIMDLVEILRTLDTAGIPPSAHPLKLHQRLRSDVVTEEDCQQELMELAPLWEENYYLVPQVLDLEE